MIRPISIIVDAAMIWLASCLLLRKDKGRDRLANWNIISVKQKT